MEWIFPVIMVTTVWIMGFCVGGGVGQNKERESWQCSKHITLKENGRNAWYLTNMDTGRWKFTKVNYEEKKLD